MLEMFLITVFFGCLSSSVYAASPKEILNDSNITCGICFQEADKVELILLDKKPLLRTIYKHYYDPRDPAICPVTGRLRTFCYKSDKKLERVLKRDAHLYKSWHSTWIGEKCPRCKGNIVGIRYGYLTNDPDQYDDAVFIHE